MADAAAGIPGKTKPAPVKAQVKREPLLSHIRKHLWLYIFLLPGLLYFFIFHYVPMYGIVIAFENFNMYKGIFASKWVGLKHFEELFRSSDFYRILINSLLISFYRLVWGFPAPIILALLLNEVRNLFFKRFVQIVIYLPHFISWVVVSGIVISFLSPNTGVINILIKNLGGDPIFFLSKKEYFRSILVASGIWKEAGWGTIIYLAALSGISPELYEAAIVDGANRWKQTLHITLPGLKSTIIVLLLLRLGNILNNGFEQIFLLYNPVVMEVSDVFETYVYRVGLLETRFDYSTAVGLFKSVVGIVLLMGSNYLSKKYGEGGIY